MKNNQTSKYQPKEVLEMLNAFYNFQTLFDPEVDKGNELAFNTTIADWRTICDLLNPRELANYYYDFFELQTEKEEFVRILDNQKQSTLQDFCSYISEHAIREKVLPIKSLGQDCIEAALFKTLMSKLSKRGVDIRDIRPSSAFKPFFDNNVEVLMETANKLVPGSISTFIHEENDTTVNGWRITIFSILGLIFISFFWKFNWLLLIPILIGLVLIKIGIRKGPKKEIIGGYETIGELIKGMKEKLNIVT